MIYNIFDKEQHEALGLPCDKILPGYKIQELVGLMVEELESSAIPGVGIAAPQVGVNKQVFIVKINKSYEVFINPEITWRSKAKIKKTERCLSVPGFKVRVERFKEVVLKYNNITSETVVKKFTGDKAQIILHEMDHLIGKTINNRGVLVRDV